MFNIFQSGGITRDHTSFQRLCKAPRGNGCKWGVGKFCRGVQQAVSGCLQHRPLAHQSRYWTTVFRLQSTLFMLPWLDEWLDVTHFEAAWNENIYDAAAAAVHDSRYNGRCKVTIHDFHNGVSKLFLNNVTTLQRRWCLDKQTKGRTPQSTLLTSSEHTATRAHTSIETIELWRPQVTPRHRFTASNYKLHNARR